VDIASSCRRCKETVGDIDILVTAASRSAVMRSFTTHDDAQQEVSQGDTRATDESVFAADHAAFRQNVRLLCGLYFS
jgi:DNA polymerase/3'-5' exonuclease PolX